MGSVVEDNYYARVIKTIILMTESLIRNNYETCHASTWQVDGSVEKIAWINLMSVDSILSRGLCRVSKGWKKCMDPSLEIDRQNLNEIRPPSPFFVMFLRFFFF